MLFMYIFINKEILIKKSILGIGKKSGAREFLGIYLGEKWVSRDFLRGIGKKIDSYLSLPNLSWASWYPAISPGTAIAKGPTLLEFSPLPAYISDVAAIGAVSRATRKYDF